MTGSMQTDVSPRLVYLDYAATAPLLPEVLDAMMPYLTDVYANPNSLHSAGREAHSALEDARVRIAGLLGTKMPGEIIFCSGGTEADNAALIGLMEGRRKPQPAHVITTAIEHHAVLENARRLSAAGYTISYLKPDAGGIITPEALRAAMRDDTALVSIMMCNNEIGSVQPIAELARVAHEGGALFHTDAVQMLGRRKLDLEQLGVDAASFSIHKIGGPKGVGLLYLRRQTPFLTQAPGGGQESGRRSGTQNVAGAVGAARALEIAMGDCDETYVRLTGLRDRLIEGALSLSTRVSLAVDPRRSPTSYVPHVTDLLVDGIESETLILQLDRAGVEVSGGSACSTGSLEPSHVLKALGISDDLAFCSLRVSMGRLTTDEDIDIFLERFAEIV